ncbi:MAG: Dps family protein [Actinomycetes bacterium]
MAHVKSTLPEDARTVTGDCLQGALADLVDLSLQAKQAHWNLVGTRFRSIHLQLDEVVDTSRMWMDTLAERAVAIGVTPDGRASTVAKQTGLPPIEAGWISDDKVVAAFVDRYHTVITRMRERMAETEKPDPVTQDHFITLIAELEKQYWMFQAEQ